MQSWPVVGVVRRRAVHLGDQQHRALQFARKPLAASADLCQLLGAVILAVLRLDQLLQLKSPGLGLAILIGAIIGIGALAGNFVGR